MKQKEIEEIWKLLKSYGFNDVMPEHIQALSNLPSKEKYIEIRERQTRDSDIINFKIQISYNNGDEKYEIPGYTASLRKELIIPSGKIHGIDLQDLEKDFKNTDWWQLTEHSFPLDHFVILKVLEDLTQNEHPVGMEAYEKLILKYLADTPYESDFTNMDKLKAKYEIKRNFDNNFPIKFTAIQAYNLMDGRPVAASIVEGKENKIQWFQSDSLAKDFTGMPVIMKLEGSEHFDLNKSVDEHFIANNLVDADKLSLIKSLMDGNRVSVISQVFGIKEEWIMVADPANNKIRYDIAEMIRKGISEKDPNEDKIINQSVQSEKTIERILLMLNNLGLRVDNDYPIRSMVYFEEDELVLNKNILFGKDKVSYEIKLEYNNGFGDYFISEVEANLKKGFDLSEFFIGGINVSELNNQMNNVNWDEDYFNKEARQGRLLDLVLNNEQKNVDTIKQQLEELAQVDSEGATMKGLLIWKHLIGTPNENYILDKNKIKKQFDIHYKFDVQGGYNLNAEEMYLLLNGRAIEKIVPASIDPELLNVGFLQLKENSGSGQLFWVPGIVREDLLQMLGSYDVSDLSNDAETTKLLDILAGGGEPEIRIKDFKTDERFAIHFDAFNMEFIMRTLGVNTEQHLNVQGFLKLSGQLEGLGFENYDNFILRNFINGGTDCYLHKSYIGENYDKGEFILNIEDMNETGNYVAGSLYARVLKYINIPDITILGINSKELEADMKAIDWQNKNYYQFGEPVLPISEKQISVQIKANSIFEGLDTLMQSMDPKGVWVAEALSFSFLRNTPNEYYIISNDKLNSRFEQEYAFLLDMEPWATVTKALNLLDGRSIFIEQGKDGKDLWGKLVTEKALKIFPAKNTFDIENLLAAIPYEDELSIAQMVVKVKLGYPIDFGLPQEGTNKYLQIHADPERAKMIFTSQDSRLGKILSGQEGWEYVEPHFREIGQERSFDTFSPKINSNEMSYLKNDLRFNGFGDSHDNELRDKLMIGYPEFIIKHTELFGKNEVNAVLYFLQNEESNYFEARSMEVEFKKDDNILKSRFYVFDSYDEAPIFNFQQAFNLLDGRLVQKSNWDSSDTVERWYYLDFNKRTDFGSFVIKVLEPHGFNLETELLQYAIKEIKNIDERASLIRSLRNGDITTVTYTGNGKEEKRHISADVRNRTIEFHQEDPLRHIQSTFPGVTLSTPDTDETRNPNGEDQSQDSGQNNEENKSRKKR